MRREAGRGLAILALALALPWAVGSWAESDKGKGPERGWGEEEEREADRSDRTLEMLDKQLELAAEQKSKVKSVMAAGKPQMDAIRKEMKALHERAMKQMFAQTEKIRTLLSDEQKMKFDHIKMRLVQRMMQADAMGPRKRRRGGRGPGRRFGQHDDEDEGEREDRPEHHHPPEGE